MKRIHLFEFEDLPWFPDTIRRSMLDYLSFFLRLTRFYRPSAKLIEQCLRHTLDQSVLDLCSGGGGPVLEVSRELQATKQRPVTFYLSDKYPNLEAFRHIESQSRGRISYLPDSVDAMDAPEEIGGMRTLYSAFHHFQPDQAIRILEDAVAKGKPIAIFDGGDKNLLAILGILLVHPVLFFFCTPFFRPFRWSRLIFTYLIPIIPLCTVWDGMVSILRLYTPSAMTGLVRNVPGQEKYYWEAGRKKHPFGLKMTYLIGYPKADL